LPALGKIKVLHLKKPHTNIITPFSSALAPSDEKISETSGLLDINFINKSMILLNASKDLMKMFGGGFDI